MKQILGMDDYMQAKMKAKKKRLRVRQRVHLSGEDSDESVSTEPLTDVDTDNCRQGGLTSKTNSESQRHFKTLSDTTTNQTHVQKNLHGSQSKIHPYNEDQHWDQLRDLEGVAYGQVGDKTTFNQQRDHSGVTDSAIQMHDLHAP